MPAVPHTSIKTDADYRRVSLWLEGVPESLDPRPSLPGSADADVVIIGAGFTGLWTAYYLLTARPQTKVMVLEAEIAGFGASGRNGGWCSALFAASKDKVARTSSRDGAIELQRAMFATVDEIGRVIEDEGIDAPFTKGGTLTFSTAPSHVPRIIAELEEERRWGFTHEDFAWLDATEAARRVRVHGGRGALYTPHCAAIDPARLARGLAQVVERKGGQIFEHTRVTAIEDGRVCTDNGEVRAPAVVRATEGYTPLLPGYARDIVPIYSLMIATEPLPSEVWNEIGWNGRETLTDGRNLLIYAQRTADDRIALGGRGAPYHFGSRVADEFDKEPGVFAELERVLKTLWPQTQSARITHSWGGCLGVPRDWYSSVGYDAQSGRGWAGGYVGDGVATTNLAGRTLADLITGVESRITRLPWVNHRSRRWEPEPLRWAGINLGLKLSHSADMAEARTGLPSRRAHMLSWLTGG